MRLRMRQLLKLATIALRCVPALFRSQGRQAIVELALRQQLATFAEKGHRPRISPADRGFWVLLSRVWSGWKETLVIVQPDTVARWHRKGFRLYWRAISKPGPGRPPIPAEVRSLIRRFANENGWRARKVRGELEKLGIFVGLSTVSRYLPKRDPDHGQRQRWSTFLRNHRHDIAAMDFLVVPTVGFRLLYAWFVIGHGRREILHFGVTKHPTSPWVIQQLREAFKTTRLLGSSSTTTIPSSPIGSLNRSRISGSSLGEPHSAAHGRTGSPSDGSAARVENYSTT